jgi:hypothetical protein
MWSSRFWWVVLLGLILWFLLLSVLAVGIVVGRLLFGVGAG